MNIMLRASELNKLQKVPVHTLEALNLYVNHRISPGSFLREVLSNDLNGAFACADDLNIANMYAIVCHCHNNTPAECWGSEEAFHNWISK